MTRTMFLVWLAVICLSGVSTGAVWEAQPTQPPIQPPVEPTPAQPEPTQPAEAYSYDPAGRRDPFVSLLNRGAELGPLGERPTGVAGLSVNEVSLRGIILSEGTYIAVLQAPDNKTYIVRGGDRLFDGSVKSITADAVIFLQEVNDPLSLVKEREVRRGLRETEEGR
jgi:Tfp pilus assembly protein PilP